MPFRHWTSTTTRVSVPSIQGNAIAPTSPGRRTRESPLQATGLREDHGGAEIVLQRAGAGVPADGKRPPPTSVSDSEAESSSWPARRRAPGATGHDRRQGHRRAGAARARRPLTGAPRSDSGRRWPAPPGRPRAVLGEVPIGDQLLVQRVRARQPAVDGVQAHQQQILVVLQPLPLSDREALDARRQGRPEPFPQIFGRQVAPHDRPAQRPRVGAFLQGLLVLFELGRRRGAALGNTTYGSRSGAASRRGSGGSPASGRAPPRWARVSERRRGARAHAVGEDRPDRRVVSIEPVAQRFPIERLLPLPRAQRLSSSAGVGGRLVLSRKRLSRSAFTPGVTTMTRGSPTTSRWARNRSAPTHKKMDGRLGEEARRATLRGAGGGAHDRLGGRHRRAIVPPTCLLAPSASCLRAVRATARVGLNDLD